MTMSDRAISAWLEAIKVVGFPIVLASVLLGIGWQQTMRTEMRLDALHDEIRNDLKDRLTTNTEVMSELRPLIEQNTKVSERALQVLEEMERRQ